MSCWGWAPVYICTTLCQERGKTDPHLATGRSLVGDGVAPCTRAGTGTVVRPDRTTRRGSKSCSRWPLSPRSHPLAVATG
jgi:hypothetical protein